jgi:transposase
MPSGVLLTPEQRGSIMAFRKAKWSIRRIASEMFVAKNTVWAFLRSPNTYGKAKRRGQNAKLDGRTKRLILRVASEGKSSSSRIKFDLDLPVSSRTIRRIMSSCPHLKYKKRKATPRLTPAHKVARLEWAKSHVDLGLGWNDVVFSDEKKFNLDGPDCLQYYWHDLRKEEQTYLSRQNGGGSVMIWAAFSSQGLSDVAFLDGRQNSSAYCDTIANYLLPFVHVNHPNGFVFQQDNASIHVSHATKAFLEEHEISLLSWPALSPDLNPIENVWGCLVRKVYANGRQFSSAAELKNEILRQWEAIEPELIAKLIASMKSRCLGVVEEKGSCTKY